MSLYHWQNTGRVPTVVMGGSFKKENPCFMVVLARLVLFFWYAVSSREWSIKRPLYKGGDPVEQLYRHRGELVRIKINWL